MFWHDTIRNLLIYDVDRSQAPQIASTVPGAKQLSNGFVACPITIQNLQILTWLKLPIIQPMVNYDFPRNRRLVETPFESQVVRSNFLVANPHSLDLSDPGTGKTLASLWAADYLMCVGDFDFKPRALIVAPLSSLERTWADAIFQHFMGRRTFSILHGSHKRRLQQLAVPADFYIINHDGVGLGIRRTDRGYEIEGLAEALMSRTDIQFVIVDEISGYRDGGTDRHRAIRIATHERRYVWGLTGTPTPNSAVDAHGIVRVVKPDLLESVTSFKQRTMIRINQFKWVHRPGAHQAAYELMQPCIRYTLEECIDLPEMLPPVTKDVELTANQKKAWRELKTKLILLLREGTVSVKNQASLRSKLMQISAGQVYDTEHKAHAVDAAPRIKVLKEAIAEAGNTKVIIFVGLTSVLTMLDIELRNYSHIVINGQVPFAKRNELIRQFQSQPHPRILLADPRCMAHSLNLTSASTCIWFTTTDLPETYTQANARIRRAGQRNVQRIVHLASNAYEREVYRRLHEKESLQDVVLKLVEEQDA